MFGLGFIEIAVICVITLILVRPRDIPRLLAKLGRLYGHASRQMGEVKRLMIDLEHDIRSAGDLDNTPLDGDSKEPR